MGNKSEVLFMDGQHKKVYKEMMKGDYTKVTNLLLKCKNRNFEQLSAAACTLFSIKFLMILFQAGAEFLIFPSCLYRQKNYINNLNNTEDLPLLNKYEFEKGIGLVEFFFENGAEPVLDILISLWKYKKIKILNEMIFYDQRYRCVLLLHSIKHQNMNIFNHIIKIQPKFIHPYPISYFSAYAFKCYETNIKPGYDNKLGPVSEFIIKFEEEPYINLIKISLNEKCIPNILTSIVLEYFTMIDM
jgi:hypothetical protein